MSRFAPRVSALLGLVLAVGCASTVVDPFEPASPIDAMVDAGIRSCACRMGVAAQHVESGRTYERNADESFEAASVIKLAVLTDAIGRVHEGTVDLSERWTLTAFNKTSESGWLKLFDPGLNPTWNDLLTLMIGPSDNTATNAWVERLGIEAINSRMVSLGFPNTRIVSLLPWLAGSRDGPRWAGLKFGTVTAREAADWLTRVTRGELFDADSSATILRYLDATPSRARLARRFSSAALWAGKTGTMSGVRNDAGILRTTKGRFVLVVFSEGSPAANDSAPTHPAAIAMGDIARAIVDEWSRDLPDVPGMPR